MANIEYKQRHSLKNCLLCGTETRASITICGKCKEELIELDQKLKLLKQFPKEILDK